MMPALKAYVPSTARQKRMVSYGWIPGPYRAVRTKFLVWEQLVQALECDVTGALGHIPLGISASQVENFMGPTWGPPGPCRPQVGPISASWTLLLGDWPNVSRTIPWLTVTVTVPHSTFLHHCFLALVDSVDEEPDRFPYDSKQLLWCFSLN